MPIDKGDTAWVLVCTALVLLMTAPGLALFYGGMVRQKNVVGGVGGALCFSACAFKARLGYDDSLDVVGVHGVGGMWGALGTASGAVAGLVVITPACGFVGPIAAIIMGGIGGALCFSACAFKSRLGYDDSLDVVGVHGVGGMWGALGTGLFAWKAINGGGADGLFHGNPGQLWTQLLAVLATIALAAPMTWLILKFVEAVVGIRVSEQDEVSGLDLSQHSENAYVLGGLVTGENVGASREERGSHKEGARVGALGKGS